MGTTKRRSTSYKRRLAEKHHRTCGDCMTCCTAIGVEELGKPYAYPCHHLCDHGCSIYQNRPDSCVRYGCVWLDGWGGPNMRPDKSGVIVTFHNSHTLELAIFELRPGAAKNAVVKQWCVLAAEMGCQQFTVYPPDAMVGTAYPINSEYPDCGDQGYFAPGKRTGSFLHYEGRCRKSSEQATSA